MVPRYAKYTVQQGVDTIILGGSTGEWPSMTSNERLACLHAWRAALDALPAAIGSKPKILFHAGDVAVERAVALAKAASGVADEILIVSPCIMKPGTPDMLLEVLGLVSAAAATTPAWYYHCERRPSEPFLLTFTMFFEFCRKWSGHLALHLVPPASACAPHRFAQHTAGSRRAPILKHSLLLCRPAGTGCQTRSCTPLTSPSPSCYSWQCRPGGCRCWRGSSTSTRT